MANLSYYGLNLQLQYSVDTIAQRDAIPVDAGYREIGTRCYVQATNTIYQLVGGIANTNWVDIGSIATTNIITTNIQIGTAPLFTRKEFTGNTSPLLGGVVTIPHTIDISKIISFNLFVYTAANQAIPPSYFLGGTPYTYTINQTNFQITNGGGSSQIINRPYTLTVEVKI